MLLEVVCRHQVGHSLLAVGDLDGRIKVNRPVITGGAVVAYLLWLAYRQGVELGLVFLYSPTIEEIINFRLGQSGLPGAPIFDHLLAALLVLAVLLKRGQFGRRKLRGRAVVRQNGSILLQFWWK